jgi:hypothetical protein
VSFKEATRPVGPVEMNESQNKCLSKAMAQCKSKRFTKAAESFLSLSKLFSQASKESKASANAMISNSYKMRARRLGEGSKGMRENLREALKYLDVSLRNEPYWAEYLESKGKLETFIHQRFGCEASFDGEVWTTSCFKVSKALGLPGISPGMTQDFECSICGKDPVMCDHIFGQVYSGRVALAVARNIRFDHVSIVDEPMQRETYILPRALTADMLRRILPPKTAEQVITHRRPLTCKDLLRAIREHRLGGIYWQPR